MSVIPSSTVKQGDRWLEAGLPNAPSASTKAAEVRRKRALVAAMYETHFERIARYIAVRIGDAGEAENLASEVFLRALRSVESYKETGVPMEAWLFKIAHNLVVDHIRHRHRRPPLVPLESAFSAASDGAAPGDQLERDQEVRALYNAMSQLTEAQRQVLALRFNGELDTEQVAQIVGKKPGAVREMQSAAIKKLRQIMARSS